LKLKTTTGLTFTVINNVVVIIVEENGGTKIMYSISDRNDQFFDDGVLRIWLRKLSSRNSR
jgi:hypothetical protein